MEFLDPNYKKKHTRLLFIGYALLSVIIFALTSLFVLEASGYYINRGGEVVVNSLLFVDSHPADATVVISGQVDGDKTEARISALEGEHFIEIRKDGYKTWQKNLLLEGRTVEFLKYPFLIPEDLEISAVADLASVSKTYQSPDRRWLLSHDLVTNTYELYDINDSNLKLQLGDFSRLKSDEYTPKTIEVLEWSRDNSSLLLKTQNAKLLEKYFVMKLRSTDEAVEITTKTPRQVKAIELADRQPKEVYVLYEGGELDRINIANEQQTVTVISPNVQDFTTYGDEIVMYASISRQVEDKTKIIISDDLTEYELTELSAVENTIYSMAIARFDGDWLYAVGSSSDDRIAVYEDPLDALELGEEPEILSKARVTNLRELKFSQNTRFVAALHDNGFVVYDAEERMAGRFNYPGLPSDYKITWMDGHRLHGTVDGLLHIWEFDGNNNRPLVQVANNNEVFFDKNYDNIYYTSKPDLNAELKNVKLVTPADQ